TQQTNGAASEYMNRASPSLAAADPFPRIDRPTRPKTLQRTAKWKSMFRRMPRSAADGFQSPGSAPAPSVNKKDADPPVFASRTLQQGLPPEHLRTLSMNRTNVRPEPWVSKSEFFTSHSTEQKSEELYNSAEHFVQPESPPQRTKSRTSGETYWETQP